MKKFAFLLMFFMCSAIFSCASSGDGYYTDTYTYTALESLQDKIRKAYPPGTMIVAKRLVIGDSTFKSKGVFQGVTPSLGVSRSKGRRRSGIINPGDVLFIKKIKGKAIILQGPMGKRKFYYKGVGNFENFEKMFLMYFEVKQ